MPVARPGGSIGRAMPTNPMTPLTANVTRAQSDELITHWYGWFLFFSSLFWPRLCIVTFWIFGHFMGDAFHHDWFIQLVGFALLPWTTMVYALTWILPTQGVFGWEWICIAFALLFDLATWGEGRFLVNGLRGRPY
jgi:hypothetical protein